MIRCDKGTMERVAWSDALDHVAHRFQHIIARDGPGAVAFYLSGQLLTEDYYVANKLMKGFLGSANVDTNSRLCMASSVAGHRRAFGADTVPGCYEDLDEADLLVLVGSNAAWCHPVLFQRMLANKQQRGARIVVIDPRRTDTAGDADLFLGLKPGTDTALFCGLLVHLADNGALDRDYIERHTTGFEDAIARARAAWPAASARPRWRRVCPSRTSRRSSRCLPTRRASVTLYSQGVNQSAQGTDKVNAILNCHLATGRIGKPGASPFSLTGQPNAMGGREVGGLANQLAAHMGFTPPDIDRVRRFWKAPRIATHEGLKAVQMFEAIARGEIKALWVMGTNPAVSLPNADAAREALKKLELFVVSENVTLQRHRRCRRACAVPGAGLGREIRHRDQFGTAHLAAARVPRRRPGEAKPDWWIIGEVAKRLGFGAAFDFNSAADIFREHAALSAFENDGERDFDIGALKSLSDEAFDAMAPVQWPIAAGRAAAGALLRRGRLLRQRPQGARFIAPEIPALRTETTAARPLRLNTGRIRDQWHTMTRTGLSPRLGQHLPEPFVEVHPDDAAEIRRHRRRLCARHHRLRAMHAAGRRQRAAAARHAVRADPLERGQRRPARASARWWRPSPIRSPASPRTRRRRRRSRRTNTSFRGFALSRKPLELPAHAWWARVAVNGGYGYLLADNADLAGWQSWLGIDRRRRSRRIQGFWRRRLSRARPLPAIASRPACSSGRRATPATGTWSRACSPPIRSSDDQRRMLLSGKSADGLANAGPIVCACFGVGRTTICDAIAGGRAFRRRDRRAS